MSHAYRSPLTAALTVLLIACSEEPPDVASAGSAGMNVLASGGAGGEMVPLAGTSAGTTAGSGGMTGSAGMSPIDMPVPETDAGSMPTQDDAGDVVPEEDASAPAPCV